MSNTITIELCQKDRDMLQAVSTGLVDLIAVLTAKSAGPAPVRHVAEQHPIEDLAVTFAPTEDPAPFEADSVTDPQPEITLDMIRKKVTALRANGTPTQRAESANIIKRRAANISGLPTGVWSEVWAELIALEQRKEG